MKTNFLNTVKTVKLKVKKDFTQRQLNFTKDSDSQLFRKYRDFKYVQYQSSILKVIDRRIETTNCRIRRLKVKRDKVISLHQTQEVDKFNEKLYRLLNNKLSPNLQFDRVNLKSQIIS